MNAARLKSADFRREREASWRRLEGLVERVERRGLRALTGDELARLPALYRAALSSLSVARAISLDRNLVEYLEALCGRAYCCVYGTKRHLREVAREFVAGRFPRTVRRYWRPIAFALGLCVAGTALGAALVARDPDAYWSLMPEGMAQDRDPTSTTGELREALYDQVGWKQALVTFATFLFTHNAQVGIFSFALGFLAGVPVVLLALWNGAILGALAALYHGRGLGADFWGWVLPHGVPELSAIAICGGAGLVIAHGLVFPGRRGRLESLADRGRDAGVLVVGAIGMLFVAGLIEGIFRQTVHSMGARYAVVAAGVAAEALYFGWAGRRR